MVPIIPKSGTFYAFALIVDINCFTKIVEKSQGNSIAQFIRDALSGGIDAVQDHGGQVVGFMGDAFLAFCDTADNVFLTCAKIAKDVDEVCEYISNEQMSNPYSFEFSAGGFSLKIGVEYGLIDMETLHSEYLQTQNLFISDAINYASRIISDGEGNRCFIGPKAMELGVKNHSHSGPHFFIGKTLRRIYLL